MAPEPISTVYFINSSHQSVCLYVYSPYGCYATAREHVIATNTRNRRELLDALFLYEVRFVSEENLWVFLFIPLSLLVNSSVNTFLRERRIGGIVFDVVCVLLKKNRSLIFPRTSCLLFFYVFISILMYSSPYLLLFCLLLGFVLLLC
jgi:hypothetical protein